MCSDIISDIDLLLLMNYLMSVGVIDIEKNLLKFKILFDAKILNL
jgi:hypothetical protein